MGLIIKIAWRNIQRHKGKSLVIGIILFLGALIMTIGNGITSGMDRGLRENIMNRFTGQIVVVSSAQEQDNVIFTPMGKDVEIITGYDKIKKVLESQDYIARFLPAAKGVTMIMNPDGDVGVRLVMGVKFEDYQKMFLNNVKLVEGAYLKNDDRGILITTGSRKKIYDEQDFWPMPKGIAPDKKNFTPEALKNRNTLDIRNDIILMGLTSENTTMDIRLDVKGVVRYEYLDDFWSNFNIIDIESFREIFHYVTATDAVAQIPGDKRRFSKAIISIACSGIRSWRRPKPAGKTMTFRTLSAKRSLGKRSMSIRARIT